ncbi:unnamed protein product [Durusdinium trenchii]|uniref:Guanylate cyclase domain-containing protein n=2 Tax=Durusdinium trenchii TaxID=1381693 RepID=A0ABP0RCA8_9DINO
MACTANKLCVRTQMPVKSLSLTEALRWLLHMLHKPVVSNVKATRAHTKTSIYRLSCNSEFIITEVHPELCRLLRYDPKEMVGMSILELMSPVVADAHAAIFRSLKSAGATERRLAVRRGQLHCRDSIVLDVDKKPVACRLSVQLRMDLSSEIVFDEVRGKLPYSVPRGFGQYIKQEPALHLVDAQEVACIMTDLANTTRFSCRQPPRVMAELLHKVYVTANAVVEREALPYVYIHEIVGDSLLLLCNAEFMGRFPGRTAAIGIYVASKVQKAVDEMLKSFASDHDMYLRVGIASGPLCAGVVDGRSFRVFGSTIHLSQRLESMCPRSQIACCSNFASQLREQVGRDSMRLSECTAELKGLGQVDYTVVDFLGNDLPGQNLELP